MLLDIEDLNIGFGGLNIVKNFSVKLSNSKILGIVGESGSGKSLSVLSMMGLLPKHANVSARHIIFDEIDLLSIKKKKLKSIRGSKIAMIFQEPMSSLNPSMTCGKQVAEVLINHNMCSKRKVKAEVVKLFEKVKLPTPLQTFDKYPHQISGGQKQRVMIAMAIACKPKLLIADEPTTALDVSVQKSIIELLKAIQQETQMSIIFISHDLALMKHIADDIMVMYKGEIVEHQPAHQLFKYPKEAYTKALLAARPRRDKRLKRLPTVKDIVGDELNEEYETTTEREKRHNELYKQQPILSISEIEKVYKLNSNYFQQKAFFKAVDNVSVDIYKGEKLGIVGESGCGKTTLGYLINRLTPASSGSIIYNGQDILKLDMSSHKAIKKDIQIIFQDPYSSLNPRLSVGEAILEPMLVHRIVKAKKEGISEVLNLLEAVGLSAEHYNRYPHEFSGGQRQRIGIARCLALKPKIIICDESVSALDISVQAQILNLLEDLKVQFNLTYIFISHDLSVVKQFCDRILVMKSGKIVEEGEADDLYDNPKHSYTKNLLANIFD
jgi:peptide/nickel transport system ATP-binding protein